MYAGSNQVKGMSLIEYVRQHGGERALPKDAGDYSLARVARLDSQAGGEEVNDVRGEMQRTMLVEPGDERRQRDRDRPIHAA